MADVVKVIPPALLEAAASAATIADRAATPHPGVVPAVSPGSPADAAAGTIAAGMSQRAAQLSARLAGKGPQVQATTQSGVAQMQAQDEQNATQIRQLDQGVSPHNAQPHGGIQAVDNHTFKQEPPPPPPDPVTKLGLPDYNPGSLSDAETRAVYLQGELRMRELNDQLASQGVSAEERAKIMFDQRNELRSWTRTLMSDRGLADSLNATQPNLTWDQVLAKLQAQGRSGDDLYNALIESSTRSRASVNDTLGIDPNHPPPLPPVHPSAPIDGAGPAPIISPPPNLPPIGQHAPAPPIPPTVLDHPPGAVPPPVSLEHPPLAPWLQDPSPPGFQVTPSEPPPFAPWDMPDPSPPPLPAPGPPITLHMPDVHVPEVQPPTPEQQRSLLATLGGGVVGFFGWLGAAALDGDL